MIDTTEILLKVVLNTIKPDHQKKQIIFFYFHLLNTYNVYLH